MDDFFYVKDNGIIVKLRALPGSSKNEFCGVIEGALKVKIKASAVDNKANEELVKFIAKSFKIPKSFVKIVSGCTSKYKTVCLEGIGIDEFKNVYDIIKSKI